MGLACAILLLFGPAPDAQGLLDQAAAYYRDRRPDEAVKAYREYLGGYPDRADVRFLLGAALLNLNQPAHALLEAHRALLLDANYARAYSLIGRVHTLQQEWPLAQDAFRSALRLDPTDRDTWYFLGRSYYEENRFDQAIEAFQRALKLKAEFSRTYENLGLAYDALNQVEAAETAYRRAVELAGTAYRPFFAYGVFLFKQNRLKESLTHLAKAAELDPNAAEARFELGKVLWKLGRLQDAARETGQALALSQECRFHHQLGRIYAYQRKHAEAEEHFRKVTDCESR